MGKVINFTKMTGAGNDFIVVNASEIKGLDAKQLTAKICDRTNGVGADGLLILDKSSKADYKMRIINADGSEAEMCGNGARCMVAYIIAQNNVHKKTLSMDTLAGIVEGEVQGDLIKVHLSDPKDYNANIAINVNDRKLKVSYIDTGVPHAVVYVDEINNINVHDIGRIIRNHEHFKPRGTNVNFVEQLDRDLVAVRTYERGVEDETKACGTGSVASGIVTYLKANPSIHSKIGAKMNVRTKSGEILEVSFDIKNNKISNVWLKGSAKFVARGEYYI